MKRTVRGPLARIEFNDPSRQFEMHPFVTGVPRSEQIIRVPGTGGISRLLGGAKIDQMVEVRRILETDEVPREHGVYASSPEIKELAIKRIALESDVTDLDDLYRMLTSVLRPLNREAEKEARLGVRPSTFAPGQRDMRAELSMTQFIFDPFNVVGTDLPTARGMLRDPHRVKSVGYRTHVGLDHPIQPHMLAKAVWRELEAFGDPRVRGIKAHNALGYVDYDQDFVDEKLKATDLNFFVHKSVMSEKPAIIIPVTIFLNPAHPDAEIGISTLNEHVPGFRSLRILGDSAALAACHLQYAESQMKLLEGKMMLHSDQEHERFRTGTKSIDIRDLVKNPEVDLSEMRFARLPDEVEMVALREVVNAVVKSFYESTELWPLFWESMRRLQLSYYRGARYTLLRSFQCGLASEKPKIMNLDIDALERIAEKTPDRFPDGQKTTKLGWIEGFSVHMATRCWDERLFPKIKARLAAEGLVDKDDPRYEDEK